METQNETSSNTTSPNIILLEHPSGSKVYLVATAHISAQAQQDVREIIERVSPAAVVLELDAQRLAKIQEGAKQNDPYGLHKYEQAGIFKISKIILTGQLLGFASGLIYGIYGAVMGVVPGGEFLAGANTADSLGADVICADRDQFVSMRRLQWYATQLSRHYEVEDVAPRKRHARVPRSRSDAGNFGNLGNEDPGSFYGSFRIDNGNKNDDYISHKVKLEVESSPAVKKNPWGLEEDADSEAAIKARLMRIMEEGGCVEPNKVLEAAQRLLRDGLDSKSKGMSPEDLAIVRQCGKTFIENFRARAAKGDEIWAQEIELESISGAKSAIGARRSGVALRKVLVDERDVILARHLWEVGDKYGPEPIVGVVGAGHIPGIQRYWPSSGSQEAALKVMEYSSLPPGEESPSLAGMAITASLLGFLAYRRPKATAIFLGAAAVFTAPTLGFSIMGIRRLVGLARKAEAASEQLETGFGSGQESFLAGEWS